MISGSFDILICIYQCLRTYSVDLRRIRRKLGLTTDYTDYTEKQ